MSATHRLTEAATELLREYGVDVRGLRLVVGCSGGVDSTVLLHLLVQLGANPVVAHVNYGLRGAQSDADEQAVRDMASHLGLSLEVLSVEDPQALRDSGASLQARCREVRYDFFADVGQTAKCTHVALGHTLDDQAETVLLHLARGSGIDGLAGMPAVRHDRRGFTVLRPLLSTSRSDVGQVAKELGLEWREDASNKSDAYARSRLRTSLAPAVSAALGEHAWLNIGRSANRVRRYLDSTNVGQINDLVALVVREAGTVDVQALVTLDPVVRQRVLLELLKRWFPEAPRNSDVLSQIDNLLTSQTGKSFLHDAVRVVRDRDVLHFLTPDTPVNPGPVALTPGVVVNFDGAAFLFVISCDVPATIAPGSPNLAIIDLDAAGEELVLRRWAAGDRIVPLGMDGSKLISDLLTDRKIRNADRQTVPVVLSGDEIVWCVGVEIGHAFRVTGSTRRSAVLVRLPG